jgi:hypothetical protein
VWFAFGLTRLAALLALDQKPTPAIGCRIANGPEQPQPCCRVLRTVAEYQRGFLARSGCGG